MSLAIRAGAILGAYEILEPLGAGGMGEVYKARDTRLGRLVAIKVLPSHLAEDTDSRERFEREARAVSQLNHPHICTLHDVGTQPDPADPTSSTTYLVMEYLEGETLEARLGRGPLPLDQALGIAIDIADALDTAHSHGVVHRDLKPGNVMLTKSGATLLDFGLAKLQAPQPAVSGFTAMATGLATSARGPLTGQGSILGTLQYMAPEQLEGLEADPRTDIFAFGALLYEIVTGRKAFQGKSQPSLISAIMSTDPPPLSSVQAMSPPALDHLVKVCLAKDPADRWRSAHDVLAQLKWIAAGGSQVGLPAPVVARRRSRERVFAAALAAAATIIVALAVPAVLYFRPIAPPSEVTFEIHNIGAANLYQLAVSPDGRRVAYLDRPSSGIVAVFIRALDSVTSYPVAGSDGGSNPFWSPDSRHIGFSVGSSLLRAPIEGGTPQVITSEGAGQASWSSDGTILFSAGRELRAVSASGGSIRKVADLDGPAAGLSFLPGGRDFLYTAPQAHEPGIYAASLDSPAPRLVLPVISNAMYAEPGLLLFVRQRTLYAQRLDRRSMTLSGEPTPITADVSVNPSNGRAAFAASQNGVLAYRTGGETTLRQFVWHDRNGTVMQAAGKPDVYFTNFDLSSDGSQLAMTKGSAGSLESDLYVMELARDGTTRRITFDKRSNGNGADVIWSPDSTELAYGFTTNDDRLGTDIVRKASSGLGDVKPLLSLPRNQFVEDWSKDGRYVAYVDVASVGGGGPIWVLPLFGDRKPFLIDESPFAKDEPHFSPDGKWLAYSTTESGKSQIQVVPLDALPVKDRIVVTTEGGAQPRWRADGRELFYLALDGTLMSVDMTTPLKPGPPQKLFATGLTVQIGFDQYAVHPDGKRFLLLKSLSDDSAAAITVVVNWKGAHQ